MRTAVVKYGQSLFDIAVQHLGDVEGVYGLAVLNGLSVTDVPETGAELALPDVINRDIADKYAVRGIVPTTAYRETENSIE